MQQLLRELGDLVAARKELFTKASVDTLAEYNSRPGAAVEPAIVVAIDHFGQFMETLGNDKSGGDSDVLQALLALAGQSRAYGVHFVITAHRLNVVSSRLLSLFTERLTLRLAEADD